MNPVWPVLAPLLAVMVWLLTRSRPSEFEVVPRQYLDAGPPLRFKGYTLYRELFLSQEGLIVSHTFAEAPVPHGDAVPLPPGMEVRLHRRTGFPFLYPTE